MVANPPVTKPPWAELVPGMDTTLRAVARRHRLAPADVDDVVQATWLQAVEHADDLLDPRAIAGWLIVIAHRQALRLHERRRREIVVDAVPDRACPDDDGPPARACRAEVQALVRDAVGRLPGRQRRLVQGMLDRPAAGYARLSAELRMPVGAIGPTRGRALAALRADGALRALVSA